MTTIKSLTESYGFYVQMHRGEIWPKSLALGRQYQVAFTDGRKRTSGKKFGNIYSQFADTALGEVQSEKTGRKSSYCYWVEPWYWKKYRHEVGA
ncbi:hypothetical protein SAMD00079811_65700 [Scytonema sp. HK-05]|nr:hypothetical protein SAMD00079811_65700 [Scytonema sp. HK-05]